MSRSRHAHLFDGFESPATSPRPQSARSVQFQQPPQSHYHEADYESDKMTRSWVKRLAVTTALPSNIQLDKSLQHPALASLAKSQTPNRLRKRPSGSGAALRPSSARSSNNVSPIESSLLLSPAPPNSDSIYTQYYSHSPYHQQHHLPTPPMTRASSLRSSSSTNRLSVRSQDVYSYGQGALSTSTIASTAATSVTSSTPKRKFSSANWLSTRTVDPSVLDHLSRPRSSSSASPSSLTFSAVSPGTTPKYLSAIGSYLDNPSVTSSSGPSSLSKVTDPFDYASEKQREEQLPPPSKDLYKVKDRDSLERITMAKLEKNLPTLPPIGVRNLAPRQQKTRFAPSPTGEDPPKLERRKEREAKAMPQSILKSPVTKPRRDDTALTDSEIAYLRPAATEDAYNTDSGHPKPVPPRNPRRRPSTSVSSTPTRSQPPPPPSSYIPPKTSLVSPLRISKRRDEPAAPTPQPPAIVDLSRTIKSPDDVWNAVRSLRMVLLREEDYVPRFIEDKGDGDYDAVMSLDTLKRTTVW